MCQIAPQVLPEDSQGQRTVRQAEFSLQLPGLNTGNTEDWSPGGPGLSSPPRPLGEVQRLVLIRRSEETGDGKCLFGGSQPGQYLVHRDAGRDRSRLWSPHSVPTRDCWPHLRLITGNIGQLRLRINILNQIQLIRLLSVNICVR